MTFSLVGCRSSKQAAGGLNREELKAAQERYETVIGQGFDYQFLQAKVKYSVDGSKALSGKLNIEHGQRICMTVTVLGIEVARIEANGERVLLVDKVNKVYVRTTVADVAARLGLADEAQIEAVEALLLGRMFVPGRGLATREDFSRLTWYPMENNELQADFVADKYQLSYVIGAENRLVATQVNVLANGANAVWEYAAPTEVAGGSMPTEESLSLTGQSRNISAQLSLSNVQLAKKGWTSFEPSANYREVTFAELIEQLKKMKN